MPLAMMLAPQAKDLGGGLKVRHLLPAAQRQAVGPFVFLDHFGPVQASPAHDVRPHPHVGLATLTYLFEGAMVHRDSLGVVQRIEPGAVNWMTAGRGIVHSERHPALTPGQVQLNQGLQMWLALPRSHEETEPGFAHTPAAQLPVLHQGGATLRVLVGQALGEPSPVATFSHTLCLDIELAAGAELDLPPLAEEQAIYTAGGPLDIDGQAVPAHTLALLSPGPVRLRATQAARCMLVGGEPLDAPRHLWWNFVSSRRERIVQAAQDWRDGRFASVPGEAEFIPLPERSPLPAQDSPL